MPVAGSSHLLYLTKDGSVFLVAFVFQLLAQNWSLDFIYLFIWILTKLSNGLCSDHGGTGSPFSSDKGFDESAWAFDANDDIDSVWGFNASSTLKVSKIIQLTWVMWVSLTFISGSKWFLVHFNCFASFQNPKFIVI